MKKLTYIILLLFSVLGKQVIAQSFVSGNVPTHINDLQGAYVDSINNHLYVYGAILDSINTWQKVSILRYNGSIWDTLSGFNGWVYDVVVHKDTLYACGLFTAVNGDTSIKYIARYNGNNWESVGSFDSPPLNLKIINDSLFVLGWFQKIDNDSINSVAKWDDTKWISFYDFPTMDFPPNEVKTIEYYQNNYYVGGNFTDSGKDIRDIIIYNNGTWQKVGQGLVGGFTTVNEMIIYQNELYITGMIDESAGNVGHTIQKWNGINWSKVGDGLQNWNNQNNGTPQAWDLTVYNNELYAAGNFSYANHIPALSLSKWDGTQWCGFGTDTLLPLGSNKSVVFYQDTMYIASNLDTINGQYANKLLKYTSGNTTAVCSLYVGIEENIGLEAEITIYPNPNTGSFTIELDIVENAVVEIYNISGQLILQKSLIKNTTEIDLTQHPKGMYFVRVETDNNTIVKKIVYQ